MSESERVVFLRGPRVVLRPYGMEDLQRLTRWINDPEVRHFLESYLPMSEMEEEEWLRAHSKRKPGDIILAIETLGGVHIGSIALHRIHWRDRTATTGTMIGEKEYWSKGLGTEAKMLFLDYAFQTLNLRKICSSVLDFNSRSLRYAEKCGYKVEGVLKEHIYRDGRYHDMVLLAVFKDRFLSIWEEWQKSQAQ